MTTGNWGIHESTWNSSNRNGFTPLPAARSVSNNVHATDTNKGENTQGLSLAIVYFMQFLAHDILKTPDGTCYFIKVCLLNIAGRVVHSRQTFRCKFFYLSTKRTIVHIGQPCPQFSYRVHCICIFV